jgi:hypothetical protein
LRGLFGLRSDTHENPFYLGRDTRFRLTTVVELPAGFSQVVLAPDSRDWQLPAGGGTVHVSVANDRQGGDGPVHLTITHEVDLNPFMVEAQGYPELVEIEKQLAHPKARTILVTRKK